MRRYNHENLDNIKDNVEIYRLATLIGLYSKEELIKYLDEIILTLEEVPNEIIEASIGKDKKIDDISMSLREYTKNSKCNKEYVLAVLIKIIAKQYYDKMLKKFNKNIKTYSSRLKSEIEEAYHNVETAKEQIDYLAENGKMPDEDLVVEEKEEKPKKETKKKDK